MARDLTSTACIEYYAYKAPYFIFQVCKLFHLKVTAAKFKVV